MAPGLFCRGFLYLGHRASREALRRSGDPKTEGVAMGWEGIDCEEGEFRDDEEPDEGGELYARAPQPLIGGGGSLFETEAMECSDDEAAEAHSSGSVEGVADDTGLRLASGVESEAEVLLGEVDDQQLDENTFEEGSKAQETPGRPSADFNVSMHGGQRTDWLYRGDREPLASMGVYHYAMYVYTKTADPLSYDAEDFYVYRFSPLHPQAARRVQVLRVDEPYKVPRLFGLAISPPKEPELFRNALAKSVLFRPYRGRCGGTDHDPVFDFLPLVDRRGCFVGPWKAWFAEQLTLNDNYEKKEVGVGKIFTIADVACSENADARQPTAAEFMAHITVAVATNLDLGAEARTRPRGKTRPDASEFVPDEFDVPGRRENFGNAEKADGGEDDDAPLVEPELGKPSRYLYEVEERILQRVAFHDETGVAPSMKEYRDEFLAGFAKAQNPRWFLGSTKSGAPSGDYTPGGEGYDAEHFKRACEHQAAAFKWASDDVVVPETETDANATMRGPTVGPEVNQGAVRLERADNSVIEFAKTLIRESMTRKKKPIIFGKEQLRFLAFAVKHLQQVFVGGDGEHVEQRVVMLQGQGGSGKTECLNILRAVVKRFFGSDGCVYMASSNSAARQIAGDTIHSCLHMNKNQKLTPAALDVDPNKDGASALIDKWRDVRMLVLDEISMVAPRLFAALSYRLCAARQRTCGADKLQFAERGFVFGGIPLVILAGDFMQLPPFEGFQRVSLLKSMRGKSDKDDAEEEKLFFPRKGCQIFREAVTDVIIFVKTYRFRDSITKEECKVLPRLFAYMREPGGRPMDEELWNALKTMQVSGLADKRLKTEACIEGYEMGIVWESVGRLMQYRAVRESQAAGQMLFYVQALDWPRKGKRLTKNEYKQALQVVSMTNTGNRLGMCPLFVGMRVRLTTKLSAKNQLVQDAVGEVQEIIFDDREDISDWLENQHHPVRKRGYVRLKYLPKAVLVKFDGYNGDHGFGAGVVQVPCRGTTWEFVVHDDVSGVRTCDKVPMNRVNIPLAPEKVRTVQTAQGMSMDHCVMMLHRPFKKMAHDDWWLHVYVMLSRVRTAAGLLIYGLPPRWLFERGPPEFLAAGLSELTRRAQSAEESLDRLAASIGFTEEALLGSVAVSSEVPDSGTGLTVRGDVGSGALPPPSVCSSLAFSARSSCRDSPPAFSGSIFGSASAC